MDTNNEERAGQDSTTLNEKESQVRKNAVDSFMEAAKAAEANSSPKYTPHSHCVQCGDEAHGWHAEAREWWCERCSAAADHKRLATWFLQYLGDEVKEGSLADNMIRLLSERHDVPSLPEKKNGTTKFSIVCTMKDRWIPHFLAALKYMQQLGNMGGSRVVSLVADGDGDFNPKFKWDTSLPSDAEAVKDNDGDKTFDAG